MKKKITSESATWNGLKQLWAESQLPPNDLAVTLAALIYLRWADLYEAEQEAIAASSGTNYKPVLPAAVRWRNWYQLQPHELQALLSNHLAPILGTIRIGHEHSLATHLYHLEHYVRRLFQISPHILINIIRILANQPFETARDRLILLDRYDEVLDWAAGKEIYQYRAPKAIAQLLVELASPSPSERIYDPCFGFAGFLTASCKYIMQKSAKESSPSGSIPVDIFGIEICLAAYLIGLVRLTLVGIDNPKIELGNALEQMPSNQSQQDGFDVIIADPPMGMQLKTLSKRHAARAPRNPAISATVLFIEHAIAQLRPGGRAIIVVPQGMLFRSGEEMRLRRTLLEDHTVEAVISLPPGAYLPNTNIQASVLVLRKTGPTKRIRMIDACSAQQRMSPWRAVNRLTRP